MSAAAVDVDEVLRQAATTSREAFAAAFPFPVLVGSRGELLEKRRKLMKQWAIYCETSPLRGDVIAFGPLVP